MPRYRRGPVFCDTV